MVAMVLRASLRMAALAVAIAILARALMRLVAWDTFGKGSFSLVGTLSICLLFVFSGVGATVGRSLTDRRWVLVLVVLTTSALLWESDVAIGLSSFGDARQEPMTSIRWIGFWSLFAAISGLAVLTPYVGVRAGRRSNSPSRRRRANHGVDGSEMTPADTDRDL
jgi:hypothetical protein